MPRLDPARDETATGPRDWTEYRAMRAAHNAMKHAQLRAIADAVRLDRINAERRTREALERAQTAVDAAAAHHGPNDLDGAPAGSPGAALVAALADATTAYDKAAEAYELARARANIARATCTAPRCTGHAVLLPADLRAAARLARPNPRAPRRIAPAILPEPATDDASAAA